MEFFWEDLKTIFINVTSAVITTLLALCAFYIKSYFYNKNAKLHLNEELNNAYNKLKAQLASSNAFYLRNILSYDPLTISSWNIYKNDESNFIHLNLKFRKKYRFFYEHLEVINAQANKKSDLLFSCLQKEIVNEDVQYNLENISQTIKENIIEFIELYEKNFLKKAK